MNIGLIIAGGSGKRMGQDIPKQFLTVNEKPVIIYTLEVFQQHPAIDAIGVVCLEGWSQVLSAYAKQFNITKLKYIIPGGENGQDSIRNGVFEIEKHYGADDIVLIHDAIRPMVSEAIISDCISITAKHGCAIAVIPCAEAMMQTEDGLVSTGSYPRDMLKRTQTPQGFRVLEICDFHRRALGTTHADCFYGDVPCSQSLTEEETASAFEANTGKVIVETTEGLSEGVSSLPGVRVRNHGPFTWGASAEKSVYHAAVLEKIAEMNMLTVAIDSRATLPGYILEKHFRRKHGSGAYYGQQASLSGRG